MACRYGHTVVVQNLCLCNMNIDLQDEVSIFVFVFLLFCFYFLALLEMICFFCVYWEGFKVDIFLLFMSTNVFLRSTVSTYSF